MILNGINNSLYNIEGMCRSVCKSTNEMCTVFSIYDLSKDLLMRYPGLTNASEQDMYVNKSTTPLKGKEVKILNVVGIPYWQLSRSESYGATQ